MLLQEIQRHLNLPLKDTPLLLYAFWHNSAVYEKNKEYWQGNERLEFLGDAVLELLVSQWLYRLYPYETEGKLTTLRAALVCEENLADCAKKMELNRWLVLGKGEKADMGTEKPAILADLWEAVLGAIYMEYGMEQADLFVRENLLSSVNPITLQQEVAHSWKNLLQEWVQGRNPKSVIRYTTVKSGEDHAPFFHSQALIDGLVLGKGDGRSKKEAEQVAAKVAYKQLIKQFNPEENACKE